MKKRHYTLQQMGDSLCLTIKGKFLNQEFGLQAGDYFQLVSQDDQLILLKQPKEERKLSAAKSESAGQIYFRKIDKAAQRFSDSARI